MKKFEIDEEILSDLVDICKALISCNVVAVTITGNENIFSIFDKEINKAILFLDAYERFNKGDKQQ